MAPILIKIIISNHTFHSNHAFILFFPLDLTPKAKSLRKKLKSLTLSTEAIWERERSRGPIVAPFIIKIPYLVLCYLLDVVFEGRYVFSRFFLLETVARMPYMSYITMLHLYETLGFWRRSSDIKRIHFAEEWNEFHHLLIMESLGGDQVRAFFPLHRSVSNNCSNYFVEPYIFCFNLFSV